MVKNLVFVIIASSIVVSCMIVKEPEKQAVAKNNAPSSIEKSIKKGYPEKNCASKSEGKNNLFLLPNDYVVDKASSKRNGQYFIDYFASKRAPVDDANQKSYIDKAKERNEQTKHVLSQKRWHDAAEIGEPPRGKPHGIKSASRVQTMFAMCNHGLLHPRGKPRGFAFA